MFGLAQLRSGPVDKWLVPLGLVEMPDNMEALKKAFRAAIFRVHPDFGGTNAAARAVMEAFEILKRRFGKRR